MFRFSLEMIDYQVKDKFPEQLGRIVDRIKEDVDIGKSDEDVIKKYGSRISKLIKDRLGLNVVMDPLLHYYMPAAILPFSNDYLLSMDRSPTEINIQVATGAMMNSIKGDPKDVGKHFRKLLKEREESFKKIHNKKGFVNTKHAKVGGYLSEVKHYLIISYEKLFGLGLSSSEVVAVTLHELGHAFVGLETHYKLITTNSAISNILEDMNDNKPDKVYYKFKRYFGDKDLIEAGVSEDSTITDFYGPLARRYMSELDSVNYNSKYDETNFENLADNFATRFGMGEELVTGLHKIHEKYDLTIHSSKTRMYITHLVNLLFMVVFTLLFIPPFGGVLLGLIFMSSGSSNANMTYDLPLDRYNRVLNAIVDNLKDTRLPVDYTKVLLEQFDSIDYIIKNTYQRKGILDTLADVFVPKNREVVYYRGIQQNIENTLNNRLFINSAKLRTS